ncbi:MAG: hypothetical protein G3M78_08625 [Candidatus Nitrohelix vancouverensis]|uniref:Uncharacterized protein n=1 Tax=Candidatus Nitrohelix vancouverensis TaxID=2705534 RepID=A0A7T0C2Q6_9BACT|nr:MAG: hypothetical protein G3M78_08625 [Candidatus Nitrohelix vancouverensis]
MSELNTRKLAVAFAFVAFGLMVFGSVLNGSTFLTALIRGFEAALIFGICSLLFLRYLIDDGSDSSEAPPVDPDTVEEAPAGKEKS